MAALQYVAHKHYSALILRRSFPELYEAGAIGDRAQTWLTGSGAVWSTKDTRWTFPSGARLAFGYCDTYADVLQYKGPEFHFIGIDEVTDWEERSYLYLISRLRRAEGDPIPLRIRSATNPGGRGHAWVKKRFVDPKTATAPFIPARLDDNPHLNREEYASNLALLDEVTRAQLRDGKWLDGGTGLVYRYDATRNTVLDLPDLTGWHAVLSVDLGSSEIKPTTAFAITLWHQESPVAYVVRSWAEAGMIPSTIAERIREVLDLYPEARIVMDVGALGSGYANEIRQRHQLPIEAAEKAQKLGFRKLLNGALERGEVVLVKGECPMLIEELESLVWAPSGLDNDKTQPNHCTDALLYGWRAAQSWRAAFHVAEPVLTEEQLWEKRARDKYHANKRDPWASW